MIGASPRPNRPRSKNVVSPTARMLTANPVTIWSARNRVAAIATTRPSSAPPTALATNPTPTLPTTYVVMTPANAPVSIMPSSPTANTPARSERIPPNAANINGAAMRSTAGTTPRRPGPTTHAPPHPRREAHRAQHEDHREALDHGDQRRGHADRALHGQRAGLEESEEQPGGEHRQRIDGAEQRDGDGV